MHPRDGADTSVGERDHIGVSGQFAAPASRLFLAVQLIGIVAGILVAGCGLLMLRYMVGQVSTYYHGVEQVLYPVAVALSLFVVASLLIMPQRLFRDNTFIRTLACFLAAFLVAGGAFALLGGVFLAVVGESADPGHGIRVIGLMITAAGILGLMSGLVLYARVSVARRNLTGPCSPGTDPNSRPASP